jgi:hypothetical protein
VSTNEPEKALAMFQRATQVARESNINLGQREFRQITAFEQKAKDAAARVAANTNTPRSGAKPDLPPSEKPAPPVNPGPTAPAVTPTPAEPKVEIPVPPRVDVAALAARVEDALKKRDLAAARRELNAFRKEAPAAAALTSLSARVSELDRELRIEDALKRRDAAGARQELNALSNEAPGAPALQGLSARVSQLERDLRLERVEDALKRRDAAGARQELNAFAEEAPAPAGLSARVLQLERAVQIAGQIEDALRRRDAPRARQELTALAKEAAGTPDLKALTARVLQLERELSDGLLRDAMSLYYAGNYRQTLDTLGLAEKLVQLSARGNFYRACSLAAQAATATQDFSADPRIGQARESYRLASRAAAEFKQDLQYISPKILKLLRAP